MSRGAIRHLSGVDEVMGRLIRRVGVREIGSLVKQDRLKGPDGPYAALVEAIVYQQLNGKAAGTILGRVRELFPGSRFPRPQALLDMPDEALRGAGLSRAKLAAVKDVAAKRLARVVPTGAQLERMSDEEIVDRLVTIRGVGRWTVEMLLIFTLGRQDVLPANDYGVRKGFAVTYGLKELPTPVELTAAGEKWKPYRSLAAWYLWRALEL